MRIAIAAVLGGLLLIVLFVGLFVVAVFGSMRSSDPYRFAVETAMHDPRVLSRLGSPVKPGWLISGSISVQNDSGQADLSIPVQGSAHKGTIHVVGKKSEGVWAYQRLVLAGEDGREQLDLLPHTERTEEK